MDIVQVDNKKIQGLSLRTSNVQEMDENTAKIPDFVSHVDENLTIDYQNGARAYSVYFNYESDVNGEFDGAVKGIDKAKLLGVREVAIGSGCS